MVIKQKVPLTSVKNYWLNNYSRELIQNNALKYFLENQLLSGAIITSESFHLALKNSPVYLSEIKERLEDNVLGDDLVTHLFIEDVRYVADQLKPIFDKTSGLDGWVSMPLSPFITDDRERCVNAIANIYNKICRPNIAIILPGIPAYRDVIEQTIALGLPLNLTHIYSHSQFNDIACSCLNGLKTRIVKGKSADVPLFITVQVDRLIQSLRRNDCIQNVMTCTKTISQHMFSGMEVFHQTKDWKQIQNAGGRPFQLIWSYQEVKTDFCLQTLLDQLSPPFAIQAIPANLMKQLLNREQDKVYESFEIPLELSTCQNHQFANLELIAEELQKREEVNERNNWLLMLETLARKSAQISQITKSTF